MLGVPDIEAGGSWMGAGIQYMAQNGFEGDLLCARLCLCGAHCSGATRSCLGSQVVWGGVLREVVSLTNVGTGGRSDWGIPDIQRFPGEFSGQAFPVAVFSGARNHSADYGESLFVTDGVGGGSVLAPNSFEGSVRPAVARAATKSINNVKAGGNAGTEAESLVAAIGKGAAFALLPVAKARPSNQQQGAVLIKGKGVRMR